jgi:hypothetical protein
VSVVTDGSSEDAKEDYINLNVTRLIPATLVACPVALGGWQGTAFHSATALAQALSKLVQLC